MKVSQGFTLIELILVLVLLGVLGAFALPRFVSLQRHAQQSVLEGMEGALRSGVANIYLQSQIEGKTLGAQSIISNGALVDLQSGYPVGNFNRGFKFAVNLDDILWTNRYVVCEAEWCGRGNQTLIPGGPSSSTGLGGKIWPKGYEWDDQCGVYYLNHGDGSPPEIGLTSAGC